MKEKYGKLDTLWWTVRKGWAVDRPLILLSLADVPVVVAIPLVQSYFSKVLIDHLGSGASLRCIAVYCTFFAALIGCLMLLQKWIESRRQGRRYHATAIFQQEKSRFTDYETDFENTEKQDFNRTMGYVNDDAYCGKCSLEFIWDDVFNTLKDALGVFACASLMAFIHPALLLIVMFTSFLSYFTTRWQPAYREKHKHLWEKETRKKSYLESLSTKFENAKDIKLYGLEEWLNRMMSDYQAYRLMWEKRCSLRGVWAAILSGIMTLAQDGAAYLFLITMLMSEKMGLGDFVFYFGVVTSIAAFFSGIIGDAAKLSERADKIIHYRELFDYPSHFNHGKGEALPRGAVEIELRNVHYRYAGAEEDTLRGLNLTIRAGESIALVGLNGAGKTTLVKLLCGLYHPTEGQILVGGKPIEAYNAEEYYSMISVVFQQVNVIAFTLLEFITSCVPDRPLARTLAEEALKSAGLWEKVRTLPNGLDTHLMKSVYDDGVDLSGGEMQKLLLARAIYKDGSILLLDEPTAALDPIAENNLYLQYRKLTQNKTSVYISHRFASTRFCDRIVLLEDGVIRESGTHDELMQHNGRYAELFNVQSKYYKEDA